MLVLVTAADDAEFGFQTALHRICQFVIVVELLAYHLRIARPKDVPVEGVDIGAEHVGQARNVAHELLHIGRRDGVRLAHEIGRGLFDMDDGIQEVGRYDRITHHHLVDDVT